MDEKNCKLFYKLLRIACGSRETFETVSNEEWLSIYDEATRQSLLGVVYSAICKLPQDVRPSMDILFQWASEAENIRGFNVLLNSEAARYTQMFAEKGRRSFILKGPANARLYPDPFSRQPGDIDIWVDGGKEAVAQMLREQKLWSGDTAHTHHISLPHNEHGVLVEVHFRACTGNCNPFSNRRLQKFLNAETGESTLVTEGFYVPGMKFALVMQLSHIQRHASGEGIGFRQLMDYYFLLKNSSDDERLYVSRNIKALGLSHVAGALMWLLQNVFHLEEDLMIYKPNKTLGEWLLNRVLEGGNFGHYDAMEKRNIFVRFFMNRVLAYHRTKLDFWEGFWNVFFYWCWFFKSVPLRIKLRKLSLKGVIK